MVASSANAPSKKSVGLIPVVLEGVSVDVSVDVAVGVAVDSTVVLASLTTNGKKIGSCASPMCTIFAMATTNNALITMIRLFIIAPLLLR